MELTSKEADLLLVLHESANKTVEREMILKRVWGDEGDYVGRTLDVFISKLRKRLEFDPSIKIINTRGVGYKLAVSK
jgi:DNA-binding response OmpR family regulator